MAPTAEDEPCLLHPNQNKPRVPSNGEDKCKGSFSWRELQHREIPMALPKFLLLEKASKSQRQSDGNAAGRQAEGRLGAGCSQHGDMEWLGWCHPGAPSAALPREVHPGCPGTSSHLEAAVHGGEAGWGGFLHCSWEWPQFLCM